MSRMLVTKEVKKIWGIGPKSLRYEIHLPAGLRVAIVAPYPMQSFVEYRLDEFPVNLPAPFTSFPIDSFVRHDAIHYGIRLDASEVEEK